MLLGVLIKQTYQNKQRNPLNSILWTSQVKPGQPGMLPARILRTSMMRLHSMIVRREILDVQFPKFSTSQSFDFKMLFIKSIHYTPYYFPYIIRNNVLQMLPYTSLSSYCHCFQAKGKCPPLFETECGDFFTAFNRILTRPGKLKYTCQVKFELKISNEGFFFFFQ